MATKLYTLEAWFFSGIILNTLNIGDNKDDDDDEDNNNKLLFTNVLA